MLNNAKMFGKLRWFFQRIQVFPKIFVNKSAIKLENLAKISHTPDFFQQKVDFAQTFRHGHHQPNNAKYLQKERFIWRFFTKKSGIFPDFSRISRILPYFVKYLVMKMQLNLKIWLLWPYNGFCPNFSSRAPNNAKNLQKER